MNLQDIAPGSSRIGFTVWALGALPLHGEFFAFTGRIARDGPACRVDVSVQVASLRMDRPGWTRLATGPTVLDAAHYPTMRFTGGCAPKEVTGQLTLHGVTAPVALAVTRQPGHLTARGTLARATFGIGGPWLLGPRVRISVDVPDAALPQPRPGQ